MGLPGNTPKSPLEGLSIQKFGGRTFGRDTVISVLITRIDLLPNNPNRIQWVVINEGANDVRLSIDPAVTTSSGWLLQANGGVISMDQTYDGEAVGYAVYAIANGATSNVRIREVIRL